MSTASKKRKNTGSDKTEPELKKRKADNTNNTNSSTTNSSDNNTSSDDFHMLTLDDIQAKIKALCDRVPPIPDGHFGVQKETNGNSSNSSAIDESQTREWAAQLQAILEEFNLYICCVATATYQWGTDRSGASDQNLNILNGEMAASQDAISATVTPRLTNVLAPVVDLVISQVLTGKREDGMELKDNMFQRMLVDTDFYALSHRILARNAPMLRQVVLSNFYKVVEVIKDFLKAQKNDTQHSRGLAY